MKFKINYELDGYADSVIIEGETIEDVREQADKFTDARGIDINTCWSEKL